MHILLLTVSQATAAISEEGASYSQLTVTQSTSGVVTIDGTDNDSILVMED